MFNTQLLFSKQHSKVISVFSIVHNGRKLISTDRRRSKQELISPFERTTMVFSYSGNIRRLLNPFEVISTVSMIGMPFTAIMVHFNLNVT